MGATTDKQIKSWVFEAVRLSNTCPPELRDHIKNAEKAPGKFPRLHNFLTNICREVRKAETLRFMKRGKITKPETVKTLVYDLTAVFIKNCVSEATRKYESDIARAERQMQAQKVQDMENTLAGNATGEFAEAGVIVSDSRENVQTEI